jgi:hypothetical protein
MSSDLPEVPRAMKWSRRLRVMGIYLTEKLRDGRGCTWRKKPHGKCGKKEKHILEVKNAIINIRY